MRNANCKESANKTHFSKFYFFFYTLFCENSKQSETANAFKGFKILLPYTSRGFLCCLWNVPQWSQGHGGKRLREWSGCNFKEECQRNRLATKGWNARSNVIDFLITEASSLRFIMAKVLHYFLPLSFLCFWSISLSFSMPSLAVFFFIRHF